VTCKQQLLRFNLLKSAEKLISEDASIFCIVVSASRQFDEIADEKFLERIAILQIGECGPNISAGSRLQGRQSFRDG
jgi:hypothetical protein